MWKVWEPMAKPSVSDGTNRGCFSAASLTSTMAIQVKMITLIPLIQILPVEYGEGITETRDTKH